MDFSGEQLRYIEKAIYHRIGWLAEIISTDKNKEDVGTALADYSVYMEILSQIKEELKRRRWT